MAASGRCEVREELALGRWPTHPRLHPRRTGAPPVGGDEGFTLVELLVAMVILPLVIGAISSVIITSLQNDTGVSTRLSDSHDAQITSANFVRDVESTGTLTTSGVPTWCGSGTQILGLEWQRNTGTTAIVSYVVQTLDSVPVLRRNFCSGSTFTVTDMADDLASPSSVVVTLACSSNFPSCSTDAAAGPTPAREVATVQIQATEASGYVYTLTAAPREILAPFGTTPPGSSPPTMLLLSSGTDVNCAGSGTGTLTVDGIAAMDSSQSGAATLGSNYFMTGPQLYSGASSVPSNYLATSSTPTATGPPIPDPYASLPDPSTSGVAVYTTTSTLPGPGVYKNLVTITHATTVSPGNYIFEGGFTTGGTPSANISGTGVFFFIGIPNAAPRTPQPAYYSIAGNSTVNLTAPTTGTYAGIVIFQSRTDSNPLSIGGNGTSHSYGGIIYAPDASVSTAGNGATSASSIVANSLTCGGNGGATIGSPISTTTAVHASPSNPTSGHAFTLTATVTSIDGLSPLGSVTFTDTPNGSSTATLCSSVAVIGGTASCAATLSSSGSPYSITASFTPETSSAGQTNFASSSDTTSVYVAAPTSTVVTGSPSSPSTGSSVTFTATISPTPDAGAVSWSITYGSGGTQACDGTTPLAVGTATCTVNSGELQAVNSPYTVTATYSGDPSYGTSSGTLNVPVPQAGTSTTGAPSAPSVAVGASITDTATVAGPGTTPTGQVQFYVCPGSTGCTSGGSIWSNVQNLAGGSASSAKFVPLTVGSYCFAAYYRGDPNYSPSADTAMDQCFTVTVAGSTTSASASASTVAVESSVTDTAKVAGPGTTPTGQVQFYVCQATAACSASSNVWSDTETISGGSATSAEFFPSNAGSYCFVAYYGGDSNYAASSDTGTDQCFTAS